MPINQMKFIPDYCDDCRKMVRKHNIVFFSISLPIFILILLFIMFLPSLTNFSERLDKPIIFINNLNFNSISNSWEDDEIITSLATFCNHFDGDENKIECVMKIATMNYDYKEHGILSMVKQPEEIINYGGVCRDYAVFYSSVFKDMGYSTKFIYEPNHVYLKICKEKCWFVDQTVYWEEE